MSAENNVPAIRFKGFSGEWEEKELGELTDYKNGRGHEDKQKTYGKYELVNLNSISIDGGLKPSGKFVDEAESTLEKNDLVMILSDVAHGNLLGRVALIPASSTYVLNQRVALLRPSSDIFPLFILYNINAHQPYFKAQGAGMSQLNISRSSVENFSSYIPEKREQTKIGNYTQHLDTLITQHQQKHDKLLSLKKALLEKMFPKQGATVPEIRFDGFNGEWEEKTFGGCFANIPSNTLSRADLNYETGLAKNIHYGDVLIKFGEVLDVEKETLPFITNNDTVIKLKTATLKDGDVIIADAAEDETVGKCTELFNIKEQIVFSGLHTIAVRPILPFASKYLGYYLNSSAYHDQLLSLMQGTKVLSISKTTIQTTSIEFPNSPKEQTKIGTLFKNLDTLITQHQAQLKKLNNIKQACLEKMFV